MKRYLSLLGQYALQYAKVRLAYRGDFFISVATMLLATVFGLAVVFLIFGRTPRLMGWSFPEILFLYGFSLLPLSLFNTISVNLYQFSDNYIVLGKFDRVLLRPIHSLFQILFEQLRLEALGDSVLALVILSIAARQLQVKVGALDILFLGVSTLFGCALYVAIFLMLTAVSFWFEDRVGIMPPVYNMIAFGRYPLDIYNPLIRVMLSWVVPFAFAGFYPAAVVLRRGVYLAYAWAMPLITIVFGVLALALWNRGVRAYSSTGT